MVYVFLILWMSGNHWLDASHCDYYFLWMLDIFFSYSHSWALLWDAIKLFESRLNSSGQCSNLWSGSGTVFGWGLNFSHYWGIAFLSILPSVPKSLIFFLGWLVGTGYFLGPLWELGAFSLILSGCFFLWQGVVSSHACSDQNSAVSARGHLPHLQGSLSMQLFPLWHSVWYSSCLGLPGFSSPSPYCRESTRLCPGLAFPMPQSRNSQGSKLGQ